MWREVLRPSTLPPGALHGAYERAVIGMAHGMLGAALVALLWPLGGAWLAGLRLVIGAAYWLVKEAGDLRRGGQVWDGIEDAAMVALGAWYGPPWWPVAMVGCGVFLMWRGARR